MHTTIESLIGRVKQFETEETTAQDRLQYLQREIGLLGLRALKRQYICEVSIVYQQNRTNWLCKLRGLRSLQEQLLHTGAAVEILTELPATEESPKPLKTIPVDLSYQGDCIAWLKALNAAKVEILSYKLTSECPEIPPYLQDVGEDIRFEPDYTPQDLDTASIAAGIFFVTGRKENIVTATTSSAIEPFSFYVDVGRLISDCDRLKTGMVTHWNSLEVYCTSWLKFVKGSKELANETTEFLEKTFSLVKNAIELADVHLERLGNHKRLKEIISQIRKWQRAFESPTEELDLTELPLVSRLLELKKDGEKLIELVASRALAVRALLDGNRAVLLDASIKLGEIASQIERLVKSCENRETAIKEVNSVLIDVEQIAGFRSVSSLAANLLGLEISPEILVSDGLSDDGDLKLGMFYKSDLEGLVRTISTSQDLSELLTKLSKARSYLRAHLPPKLMYLQQFSSAAICAFEAIMHEENPNPSLERLEDDTLRNRITTKCQLLSDTLDDTLRHLEDKLQATTLIEANIKQICKWMKELFPRIQSTTHLLSICTNESAIPEAVQFAEMVEDPTDLLDKFKVEREHYARIIELAQSEVDSDPEILSSIFEPQMKSIVTRFDQLVDAVKRMEDLWLAYLSQDDAVSQELTRESENLKLLTEGLENITMQTGHTPHHLASNKERIDAMKLLAQLIEEAQQIRDEYIDMISRVEVLSNRCFNRDTFRMHLKRRKLLSHSNEEENEQFQKTEKLEEQSDSLSKICANLSFRLASVDTLNKRCLENISKRMTKVQTEASSTWSNELNILSNCIERINSFVEVPLLLKPEQCEALSGFFVDKKREIQVGLISNNIIAVVYCHFTSNSKYFS